ncbi:MAG: TauD/TfdA family dioxygenase [Proteobacteria bacterium]|nr:TauD/TfdA family dioxygenase [Pseudomonadota bacterium]
MNFRTKHLNPIGLLLESNHRNEDIRNVDIEELRAFFHREHLVVLRGFRTFEIAEEFSDYCSLLGEISLWPFGKVLELLEQEHPTDHIFDHSYVPLHWDGMYRPQVPEFQIFHCVSAPRDDQGGRTTFSNTAIAAQRATVRARALWARVTGVYHRKMEFYESKTVAPILTKHPVRGFPVIRYCEPAREGDQSFVNHPTLEFQGVTESEATEFHRGLREALYAPENFYAHAWQTGDVVIADNYTLLHGREAFTSGAPRHLRRVHVLGEPPLNNPHLVSHI